ncbi:MAG: hypothetical protein A2294_03285 [Candidatus Magasanikbacteria bacterium RIFOXYB2_FULL_38_10]|nr:MAG: hypothetical protein A2294_03285 [Candidatus Magasanikbacteria bacterium RIFOXYB2_FULL_38_10]
MSIVKGTYRRHLFYSLIALTSFARLGKKPLPLVRSRTHGKHLPANLLSPILYPDTFKMKPR